MDDFDKYYASIYDQNIIRCRVLRPVNAFLLVRVQNNLKEMLLPSHLIFDSFDDAKSYLIKIQENKILKMKIELANEEYTLKKLTRLS